jgi:hypothetical protein
MGTRSREPIATDKSTVFTKVFLDPIIVEDGEGDRGFPDPPCTDEGDRVEVSSITDDIVDELVTAKTGTWGWGR